MEAQRPKETLEGLLYPVVILDRHGNICFMNGAARRLLPEGLDLRLAAYVRSKPDMGPITQVHFKLQNGHDLVLKVRLGEIEWLGEKATQVSLSNVTLVPGHDPGAAERVADAEAAAGRTRRAPRGAGQASVGVCGRVRRPRQGAGRHRGLRENLDRVTQENKRLQSDLARAAREHQESKEALAASLKQARQQTEAETTGADRRRPISQRSVPPRPRPSRPSPCWARNWRRSGAIRSRYARADQQSSQSRHSAKRMNAWRGTSPTAPRAKGN